MITYNKIRPKTWVIFSNGSKLGYVCKRLDKFFPVNKCGNNTISYLSLKEAVKCLYNTYVK